MVQRIPKIIFKINLHFGCFQRSPRSRLSIASEVDEIEVEMAGENL